MTEAQFNAMMETLNQQTGILLDIYERISNRGYTDDLGDIKGELKEANATLNEVLTTLSEK